MTDTKRAISIWTQTNPPDSDQQYVLVKVTVSLGSNVDRRARTKAMSQVRSVARKDNSLGAFTATIKKTYDNYRHANPDNYTHYIEDGTLKKDFHQ